ncbi:hypothetical protein PM8797T_21133 [Gimesia maris DSM 8797]|nr:hypothetical protein PM8797T_21133 [Gimesia maris DSM 8797]
MWRGVGSVRQKWCIPQKKRILSALINKFINGLHTFATDFQSPIAMAASPTGVAVSHPGSETCQRRISFPPFSGLKTLITDLSQHFRQAVGLFHML